MSLSSRIKTYFFVRKWRKNNPDNETYPLVMFDTSKVTVGRKTYGELYVNQHGSEGKLSIGDFCSIGPNVVFLLSSDHAYDHLSTFPFKVKYGFAAEEATSKGDIIVEDDVWIGYGTSILSGVHIGRGAVIAAGSIVTKDVPPYSIVGGNPAKVIKYRFSSDIIDELMKFDYKSLTDEKIVNNIDALYKKIENVEDIPEL